MAIIATPDNSAILLTAFASVLVVLMSELLPNASRLETECEIEEFGSQASPPSALP
jgi:hypothetical protein